MTSAKLKSSRCLLTTGTFLHFKNYGVLVTVGVPVAVDVAEGAAGVELVAVGVAEAVAVAVVVVPVPVAVGVTVAVAAAGTEAPEALKMIGPVHKARSPVAGPVERIVRIGLMV